MMQKELLLSCQIKHFSFVPGSNLNTPPGPQQRGKLGKNIMAQKMNNVRTSNAETIVMLRAFGKVL